MQQAGDGAHGSVLRAASSHASPSKRFNSGYGVVPASGRTSTRYAPELNPPASRSTSRIAARRRRRTRLRSTAVPTHRPTLYATRTSPAAAASASRRNNTVTGSRRARRPSRRSASNVARSPIRPIRPTAGRGPSGAGPGRWPGRRGFASAAESRAAWLASGCWVGTCASPSASSSTRPPRSVSGACGGVLNSSATRWIQRAPLRCADNGRAPPLECANPGGYETIHSCGPPLVGHQSTVLAFPNPPPSPGVRQRNWRLVHYLTSGCRAVIHMCGLLVDDFGCQQEGSGP